MEVENNLLKLSAGASVSFQPPPASLQLRSPNAGVESLIIRSFAMRDVQAAKNFFTTTSGLQLFHLLIGRDGREIVQMVPFDRKAGVNFNFNKTAISLGLINPGDLAFSRRTEGSINDISRFTPQEVLSAFGENDNRFRWWATYPSAQLDLLLEICLTLIEHFRIRTVRTYEELLSTALDPGPSFPKLLFYEALKAAHPELSLDFRVLEETNTSLTLRHSPAEDSPLAASISIPAATAAAVVDEQSGNSLIEVVSAVDGNRWLKGWVKSSAIRVRSATPKVKDHRLVTDDGRSYPFIEAVKTNYNPRPGSNQPKYLIMHFTTGTEIRQAVNTFQDPKEGTSIHLIIGRDGRVIQMVPFDRAAFHAGLSFWENQSNLNNFTIGIELDNAGFLARTRDALHWQRKGVVIPDENTHSARHIKDFKAKQWEKFPQQQVDAAFVIAKALVEELGLEDILGHDQVNFPNRYDPGPLFEEHLEEWRLALYGRREAKIEKFRVVQLEAGERAGFYVNREGRKPKLNHPVVPGPSPAKGKPVKVIEKLDPWWQIRVLSGSRPVGWMRKENIRVLTEITKIDRDNAVLFQVLAGRDAGPPPIEHPDGKLPAGTELRIQKVSGDMALVVARVGADPIVREEEGWVRIVDIERV